MGGVADCFGHLSMGTGANVPLHERLRTWKFEATKGPSMDGLLGANFHVESAA